MPVWTAHIPPAPASTTEAEDRTVLIREGFSWAAFVFAPVWALAHRLWLAFMLWLAVTIGISLLAATFGSALGTPLSIAFALWFGCVANDFRRGKLDVRGWRLAGIVDARTARDAELRFFAKAADDGAGMVVLTPAQQSLPMPRFGGFPPVVGYPPVDRIQGDRT